MSLAMSGDISIQWRISLLAALALVAVLVSGVGASGGSAAKPSPSQIVDGIEAERPEFVPGTCQAIARGEGASVEAGIDAFNRSKRPPPGYPSAASTYQALASRC
jgi:hypothetical protein